MQAITSESMTLDSRQQTNDIEVKSSVADNTLTCMTAYHKHKD